MILGKSNVKEGTNYRRDPFSSSRDIYSFTRQTLPWGYESKSMTHGFMRHLPSHRGIQMRKQPWNTARVWSSRAISGCAQGSQQVELTQQREGQEGSLRGDGPKR